MQKIGLSVLIFLPLLIIGCSYLPKQCDRLVEEGFTEKESGNNGTLALSGIVSFVDSSITSLVDSRIISFTDEKATIVPCSEEQTVLGFDFDKFSVAQVPTDSFTYRVCRNSKCQISAIIQSSGFSTCKFHVIRNDKDHYIAMVPEFSLTGGKELYLGGIFLLYEGHWYFMTLQSYPIYVMQLDSNLNVVQTVRTLQFSRDKFYYKTRINYTKSGGLYSETFFNLSDTVVINEKTSLADVVRLVNSQSVGDGEMELRLGMAEVYERCPFWLVVHPEYDYDVIKNKKILELAFKERMAHAP